METERQERELLDKLDKSGKDSRPALWNLAAFYNRNRRPEESMTYLRRLLALESDLEKKAACILAMGGAAEQMNDFPGAILFYREAMSMEPLHSDTWYFIHNNLGYSLNKVGQFEEGEKCCLAAIRINPSRPNAHKNRGIALAGQGRYCEAAQCYITATQNHAGDARAFELLEQLVGEHPELGFELQDQIARCRKMVGFAILASNRAGQGEPFRAVLGLKGTPWLNLCGYGLTALSGRNIQINVANDLEEFVALTTATKCEIAFLAPEVFPAVAVDVKKPAGWRDCIDAVRKIKAQRTMAIVLVGSAGEITTRESSARQAGADALLEDNDHMTPFVETVIHLLEARSRI